MTLCGGKCSGHREIRHQFQNRSPAGSKAGTIGTVTTLSQDFVLQFFCLKHFIWVLYKQAKRAFQTFCFREVIRSQNIAFVRLR